MLRILIIGNDPKRSKPLRKSLLDNGFNVVAHVEEDVRLQTKCRELAPDMVIFDIKSPSQNNLDNVSMITTIPVVMFTQDDDKGLMQAATKVGVSGFIVGTIPSERLIPVIAAAIARFEETKQLREALEQANTKLADRKIVERAKGILMQQRELSENEAYKMLRSMAMKKNMKLAELSNQLINTAKMLTV